MSSLSVLVLSLIFFLFSQFSSSSPSPTHSFDRRSVRSVDLKSVPSVNASSDQDAQRFFSELIDIKNKTDDKNPRSIFNGSQIDTRQLVAAKHQQLAVIYGKLRDLALTGTGPKTCTEQCLQENPFEKYLCAPSVKSHSVLVERLPNQTTESLPEGCGLISLHLHLAEQLLGLCFSELWIPADFVKSLLQFSRSPSADISLTLTDQAYSEHFSVNIERLKNSTKPLWTVASIDSLVKKWWKHRLNTTDSASAFSNPSIRLQLCAENTSDYTARRAKARLRHIKMRYLAPGQSSEPFVLSGEDTTQSIKKLQFSDESSGASPRPTINIFNLTRAFGERRSMGSDVTAGSRGVRSQRSSRSSETCTERAINVNLFSFTETAPWQFLVPRQLEVNLCAGACASIPIPRRLILHRWLIKAAHKSGAIQNVPSANPDSAPGSLCCRPTEFGQLAAILYHKLEDITEIITEPVVRKCGCL